MLFRQKRRAKLTIPVDETPPGVQQPRPPAPPTLPGIQANRVEMTYFVHVGPVVPIITGSYPVHEVAPMVSRMD